MCAHFYCGNSSDNVFWITHSPKYKPSMQNPEWEIYYTVTPHFPFSQFSVFQTMDTPRNFRLINLAIFAFFLFRFFSLREKKHKKIYEPKTYFDKNPFKPISKKTEKVNEGPKLPKNSIKTFIIKSKK